MTVVQEQTRKSTIVRAGGWRLRAPRAVFGALERIAPRAGGRWAARLWCTLPGSASGRRDDRPDLSSERRLLTTARGMRLAVETWGEPDAAPVYLVHGWGGWRGQLGAFVRPLVGAGYRAVAFDAPSHGESWPGALGPRRSTPVEPAEALAAVVAEYGEPAGVVAHSLGGVSTVLAMADGLVAPPRLVLVAPAADPFSWMPEFASALGFGPRVTAALVARLERYADRPMDDFAIANLLRRTAIPPCLVVHDAEDRETPFEHAERLVASWPDAGFLATTGLGHRRILRDADVVTAVTRFVGAAS